MEFPGYLLAVLTMLVWIRIISFLRLFSQTRSLIRLLIEVIKDMIPFMLVLLIGVGAFTTAIYIVINNHSLAIENERISFVDSLKHVYRLMFGDFDTDNYGTPLWILFIFSSIFMPLIMLNMLIAIMSDTYERVSSNSIEADGKELNTLILE